MEKMKYILLILAFIYYPANILADIIHQESFESVAATSNWEAADMFFQGGPPATDFFIRTNGSFTGYSPHPGNTNGEYSIFYRDTDANGLAACTVTVAAVAMNSALYNNPQVQIAFSTAGSDYEISDQHEVYVSLDGGAYGLIGRVCGTSPNTNYMMLDSNLDGTGDTQPTTTNFTDYTFNISGSFTQVQIRVISDINFDTELAAMDNIRLLGDPISLGGRGDILFGIGYPGYARRNTIVEDIQDISANKYRFFMRGAGTTWNSGEYFTFAASGVNYIRSLDNDDYSFTDNTNDKPFSVSCWANVQETNTLVFIGKSDTLNREWWFGVNSAGQITVFLTDESEDCTDYINSSNTIDGLGLDFEWHHYGMTYDGSGSYSGLTVYLDGEVMPALKAHSGTNPYISMENLGAPLDVGALAELGLYYDMWMRQIKVWNRRITDEEMHNDAVNTRDGNL